MTVSKNHFFSYQDIPLLFIRFYLVGYLLFALPWTRGWFVSVTALSLLLVIGVVFYYHKDWRIITCCWFTFIMVSSFLLEMKGVASGEVFGRYQYGKALGWKIEGTPLIIGINWLFLVYGSRDIVTNWIKTHHAIFRIIIGAVLMIAYDLLMEYVAPGMQMWFFESGYPPLSNFVVWFIAGLVYHAGFEYFQIRTDNLPARWLFIIQWLFFLLIAFYHLIFSI